MNELIPDKYLVKEGCEAILEKVGLTREQVQALSEKLGASKSKPDTGYSRVFNPTDIKRYQRKVGMHNISLTLTHEPTGLSAQGTGPDYNKLYRSLLDDIKLQLAE